MSAYAILDFFLGSREDAVRTILNRHVRLSSDDANTEKEDLLREKLMVPQQWIHHAKVDNSYFITCKICFLDSVLTNM